MSVTHKKPTTEHWRRFSKSVSKLRVFDQIMDVSFTQAFWSYVKATEAMELYGATITAQQNSTLTMMYLHTLRMVFGKLLEDREHGVLTLDFLVKMAAVKSEEDMDKFVLSEFIPKIQIVGLEKIPNFDSAKEVFEDMFVHWKSSSVPMLKKQANWISSIRAVYDKLVSVRTSPTLMKGLHELITSIHFMIVTSPKAVLNHFPCLASLGATTKKLNRFCNWNKNLFDTINGVRA